MRVMLVSQFYPPVPGGVELHVRTLGRELVRRGHQVDVVTMQQGDDPPVEDDDGICVTRVDAASTRVPGLHSPGIPRAAPPFPDPLVTVAVARRARQGRPDVIHGHNWLLHSALPVAAAWRIAVVESLHNYGRVCANQTLIRHERACAGPGPLKCAECTVDHYGPIRGPVTLSALWSTNPIHDRIVRHYLPVSRAVAELNRLPASGRQWSVVPNFVPDDVATPSPGAEAARGLLPDEPFLLYVGALGRVKGVSVLFDAYRRLAQPRPPLVVIGFATPDMEALLAARPPGTIVHLDWPHAWVMEAWRRCLAGVVPSLWHEPCPTVVIEGMSVGVPIVGSRAGGIPDLLADGQAGILTPPGNADALAGALGELIGSKDRRAALSAAARERSTAYRVSAVVPTIERIYASVGKRAAAPR